MIKKGRREKNGLPMKEVEVEGTTVEREGGITMDVEGGEVVEAGIAKVGGKVNNTRRAEASILKDVAMIVNGLEEDGWSTTSCMMMMMVRRGELVQL